MRNQEIVITDDHIKLLNRLNIRWDDDGYEGAPAVDLKRPYGNSDVTLDIVETLGWKTVTDRWGEEIITDEQYKAAVEIHKSMDTVLTVLVQNPLEFSTGTWCNVHTFAPYAEKWRKVSD